jgi:hypothetical protein
MHQVKSWIFSGLIVISWGSYAQENNALSPAPTSALTHLDSLTIFQLIDSLLTMEEHSQLGVRVNYNSNVLSAGRTLGIQQFGLSPGISYYHKSGVYADVSGFWTNDFIPKYYLTTLSAGYSHFFSKRISAIISYDRFLYRTVYSDAYIPYTNAFILTPFFDFKLISLRFDYSFYFGAASVHRFMPGVTVNLEKKNYRKFKRIAFLPAVYVLYGNEKITEINIPYTDREIHRRQRLGLPWYEIIEKDVWGIMNYSINLPFYVSFKNWSTSIGYTYSIPKALSNEPFTLTNTGFITAGCTYYFQLRSRKTL